MSKNTRKYVLVLDVSGSMLGRPFEILKQACQLSIKDLIPNESYLGIVEFGTTAGQALPLSVINTANRYRASKAIESLVIKGSTPIGSGLLLAVQVLRNANQSTEGARLVLLTDGQENVPPYISEILPQLLSARIQVYAVALGRNADQKLEKLSRDTNGKCYMFQDISGSSTAELNRIFMEIFDVDRDRVGLMSKQHVVNEDTTNVRIVVDKELGKNAMFVVSSKDISAVDADLIGPDGQTYTISSEECNKDDDQAKRVIYKIPQAQPGEWNLKIKCKENSDVAVDVNVCSEAANPGETPITVRTWMSSTTVQYPDVPKVFAHVTKGDDFILGANVQATVTSDSGKKITLTLKDGGKGDGFYYADFTPFDENARRYNVTAEVRNTAETYITGEGCTNLPVSQFVRTATAGSVAVTGKAPVL